MTPAELAELFGSARSYRPVSVVTARRLSEPLTWYSERGAELHAAVGDWELVDAAGARWTVAPATFARSYRPRSDGRYEKHEMVQAVRLTEPAQIPTREGLSAANRGDWVLRDSSGAVWPVVDRVFRDRYDPA